LRRVIFAIVATAAALAFLLSFKTHSSPAVASSSGAGGSFNLGTGKPAKSAGSPAASSGSKAAASAARTVTGDEAQTLYGPVQVKITVAGGKVTAAGATEYPLNSPRDQQINSYAIPALNSEAVAASSANIDSVSGATYTSQGYITSLQSALNKAGL
jgi:uncharacterized protein with FMN-binding domain